MTEQEFEKLWQENRAKLLANDEEYKRISKSYMAWGWLDYLVLIGGFVICETFVNSFALSTFVKFALEILGMFIIWLGFRLINPSLTPIIVESCYYYTFSVLAMDSVSYKFLFF